MKVRISDITILVYLWLKYVIICDQTKNIEGFMFLPYIKLLTGTDLQRSNTYNKKIQEPEKLLNKLQSDQ